MADGKNTASDLLPTCHNNQQVQTTTGVPTGSSTSQQSNATATLWSPACNQYCTSKTNSGHKPAAHKPADHKSAATCLQETMTTRMDPCPSTSGPSKQSPSSPEQPSNNTSTTCNPTTYKPTSNYSVVPHEPTNPTVSLVQTGNHGSEPPTKHWKK